MSKRLKRKLWANSFILILSLIAVAVCVWLIASSIPSNEAERMLVSLGLLASSVLVLGGVASTLLLIWVDKFNQEG